MSYIPFGQDKAVIKTGNASIQVIHIVWDSISKLRSNRSLLVSTYDVIFTSVTISNFIYHCHNYVFACQNKKSKIYQELANFCEISLFVLFVLVIIFFFCWGEGWVSVVVWLLDFHYLCNQCLSPLKLWDRIPLMVRCTWYNIVWKSLSVTCGRSVVFSGYSGFLHQ
jgi:hypothetical protein